VTGERPPRDTDGRSRPARPSPWARPTPATRPGHDRPLGGYAVAHSPSLGGWRRPTIGQRLARWAPGLVLLGLALALALVPGQARADEPTPAVVAAVVLDRARAHGVDPAALGCTLYRESRFVPSARGRRGEIGVAQWLPGGGNAWDQTSAWREQGIDLATAYARDAETATWIDVDMAAELFARGPATRRAHWAATYCEAWPAEVAATKG